MDLCNDVCACFCCDFVCVVVICVCCDFCVLL